MFIIQGHRHGIVQIDPKHPRRAQSSFKVMHLILQHDVPDDYVIGTGEAHTVREFLEAVFERVGEDREVDLESPRSLFSATPLRA